MQWKMKKKCVFQVSGIYWSFYRQIFGPCSFKVGFVFQRYESIVKYNFVDCWYPSSSHVTQPFHSLLGRERMVDGVEKIAWIQVIREGEKKALPVERCLSNMRSGRYWPKPEEIIWLVSRAKLRGYDRSRVNNRLLINKRQ